MLGSLLFVFLGSMVARVGWNLATELYDRAAYFVYNTFIDR